MGLEYWEQVIYHPSATMKTSDLLKKSDQEIMDILDGVMNYRYGDFEPTFIEIMELDKLAGKKVLEIGAGVGTDAVKMAMLGAKVTAVDVLPTNVAVVSKNLTLRNLIGHTIYVPDLMELDITKDFDVLYSFGCLHHIQRERIKEVFEHLLTFLKPGATILMMVYTKKVCSIDYHEGDIVVCYNEEEIRNTFGDKVEILELKTFHGGDFWKIKGKLKGEEIIIEKLIDETLEAIEEERPTEGRILQIVTDEGERIIKFGEEKGYEVESIKEIIKTTEVEILEGEDYSEDVKEQFDFLFKKKKEE